MEGFEICLTVYLYFLKISPRVNIEGGADCILESENPLKTEYLHYTVCSEWLRVKEKKKHLVSPN